MNWFDPGNADPFTYELFRRWMLLHDTLNEVKNDLANIVDAHYDGQKLKCHGHMVQSLTHVEEGIHDAVA